MNQSHSYTLLATPDQGWATLLQDHLAHNGFAPLCCVQTSPEVSTLLSQVTLRLVLLDLQLPGKGVVDLCTEILRVCPAVKVILVTDNADELPVAMLNGRVAGCLNRNVPLAAWPGLLTYTLQGGAVFGGNLLGALLAETRRVHKRHPLLHKV
jgi:DNA-binding NarL/FixJ family response regulator